MPSVRIQCDICGAVRQGVPGVEVAKLRLQLNKVGWDAGEHGDLCSRCRYVATGERR